MRLSGHADFLPRGWGDEGLLYYKKLLSSGVDASSITINGTVHAGDMIFINATPKIYRSSLMHINNFANSL